MRSGSERDRTLGHRRRTADGPLAGNVVVLHHYKAEACSGVLTPAEYLDLIVQTAGSIDARFDRFCEGSD